MSLVNIENTGYKLVEAILSKKVALVNLEMSLTIPKTLSKPLVRTVFKEKNDLAFTFVGAIVKRFVDSFGFSTKMTPTQVEILTVDTLENFGYESVEDIILFFKMARSGKLGSTNRGVDSNLIFGEWFPKYMELKVEAREREHETHKSLKSIEQRGVEYSEVIKTYKNQALIAFKKKVSNYVDKITQDMDRQMLEDTIIDWQKNPEKQQYVYLLKAKRQKV